MDFSFYNIIGFISSSAVFFSLAGVFLQLKKIFQRKKLYALGELGGQKPTEVLSLNRFSCSYLAFFAMFLYAFTMQEINYYIGAPRMIAIVLLLVILFEIQRDRQNLKSRMTFILCLFFAIATAVLCFTPFRTLLTETGFSQSIVTISTFILFQGVVHQIVVIRKTGQTGALSKNMYELFLVKDVTSLIFGFSMGLAEGWPVIVMHLLSVCGQGVTIYHFRWVEKSPLASARRQALA